MIMVERRRGPGGTRAGGVSVADGVRDVGGTRAGRARWGWVRAAGGRRAGRARWGWGRGAGGGWGGGGGGGGGWGAGGGGGAGVACLITLWTRFGAAADNSHRGEQPARRGGRAHRVRHGPVQHPGVGHPG